MTRFRMRWKEAGGHTHVRVFAGTNDNNMGKCGDLVFRNEEWLDFAEQCDSSMAMQVEIVKEDE